VVGIALAGIILPGRSWGTMTRLAVHSTYVVLSPNNFDHLTDTYFTDIHVVALSIYLRVVETEYFLIDLVGLGHDVAVIIRLDDISSGAIIANCSQAQNLTWK
jgi:hypothetical protein